MNERRYITITIENFDDLVTKYLEALDRIMDLEIESYEIQEELLKKKTNKYIKRVTAATATHHPEQSPLHNITGVEFTLRKNSEISLSDFCTHFYALSFRFIKYFTSKRTKKP